MGRACAKLCVACKRASMRRRCACVCACVCVSHEAQKSVCNMLGRLCACMCTCVCVCACCCVPACSTLAPFLP